MNKIYSFVSSRFSLKKYRIYLLFALCFGVVMILLGNRVARKEETTPLKEAEKTNKAFFEESTETNIEEKLESILSEVYGTGKIRILITYESTDEKLVLKDSDGRGGDNTVIYGGTSEKGPFVYKKLSPQVGGVIVVAEGGDNPAVKNLIADAVSTVLEIPMHKVKVLKMK